MVNSSARGSCPVDAVAEGDGEEAGLVLGAGEEVVAGTGVPVATLLGLGEVVMNGVESDGSDGECVGDAVMDFALCDATAVPLGVPSLASPARDDTNTAKATARNTNRLDGEMRRILCGAQINPIRA